MCIILISILAYIFNYYNLMMNKLINLTYLIVKLYNL